MSQSNSSLAAKTVTGAVWTTAARLCQNVLTLISSTVLARLLTPAAYGIVGMAVVVTGFISIFRTLGTTAAIIQRKELTPNFIASIFWANVILGAVTMLTGMAVSPALGWIYAEPKVVAVTFWLSTGFFFSGLGGVHEALLVRAMAFRKLMVIEITSGVLQLCAAIFLASHGFGVWSLVGAQLTLALSGSIMLICAAGVRPRLVLEWSELRQTLSFSANLSGFSVVNYFSRNADNFLVGRFLGAAPLGYYQFAYNLMLWPLQNVTQQLGRVLFPALSQLQDDNARFRKAYLAACTVMALVAFPMMIGLLATAGPFVLTMLGPKWTPVGTIVSVLAPVGLLQAVVTTHGQIFIAKGRTDLLLRTSLISNAVILPSFVIGLHWGVVGVAAAYAIAYASVSYFILAYAFRLIELCFRDFFSALSHSLLCSVVMGAGVVALRLGLRGMGVAAAPVVLVCSVTAGIVIYAGLMFWTRPAALTNILDSGWVDNLPGFKRLREKRTRQFAAATATGMPVTQGQRTCTDE